MAVYVPADASLLSSLLSAGKGAPHPEEQVLLKGLDPGHLGQQGCYWLDVRVVSQPLYGLLQGEVHVVEAGQGSAEGVRVRAHHCHAASH